MMWLFVKLNLPSGQSVLSPPWKPHAAQNALIGSVGLTDTSSLGVRSASGGSLGKLWEIFKPPLFQSHIGLVNLTDGGV